MSKSSRLFQWGGLIFLSAVIILGAWAVENQNSGNVTPADFDPFEDNEIPDTTIVDIQIDQISVIGEVFMIEGLENETTVSVGNNGSLTPGETSFPRLVLHGVFHENMRNWREDVMDGDPTKRDIDITFRSSDGTRRLRYEIFDAWPTSFRFPTFSVDSSTRYMERMEFVYEEFDITD